MGREFISHATVNHSIGQYVNLNNDVTTNRAEGYFSQLKRSLDGLITTSPSSTCRATWLSSTSGTPLARWPMPTVWRDLWSRRRVGG